MKTYLVKLIYSLYRYTTGLERIPEFLKEKEKKTNKQNKFFSKVKIHFACSWWNSFIPCSGGLYMRVRSDSPPQSVP